MSHSHQMFVHGRHQRIHTDGLVQDFIGAGGKCFGFHTACSSYHHDPQMFSVVLCPRELNQVDSIRDAQFGTDQHYVEVLSPAERFQDAVGVKGRSDTPTGLSKEAGKEFSDVWVAFGYEY